MPRTARRSRPLRSHLLGGAWAVWAYALAACATTPPGIDDRDLRSLASVEHEDEVAIYFDAGQFGRGEAERVLAQVAAVRSEVRGALGLEPLLVQLVIYTVPGAPGAAGSVTTEHLSETDGVWVRFRYPLPAGGDTGPFLTTVAHEVAEATLLGEVTVIDPYLRWFHDGVAEMVEHRVGCERGAAEAALRRSLQLIARQRAAGTEWIDLTRWRQVSPALVRSYRFLGVDAQNLSVADVQGGLRQVRRALEQGSPSPLVGRGLVELEELLVRAADLEALPWRAGEARSDDPLLRDHLFYLASFAWWLDLERRAPGTLGRAVAGLVGRRRGDDHVLTAREGLELVRAAAGEQAPLTLSRLELSEVARVLEAELARIAPTGDDGVPDEPEDPGPQDPSGALDPPPGDDRR